MINTLNKIQLKLIIICILIAFTKIIYSQEIKMNKNKTESIKSNRLIKETSPYLLQHAHNPVDWFPWSEEAFELAKKLDKPIFLSIGYSTCHWCHVMENESFENEEIAKLMNESFINIKVDREARPDIDNIYMTVCQMLTGSGGWPLTIIMTPDKKPFFAGTYFPPKSMFGRLGMIELIPKIDSVWKNDRESINENSENIINALKNASSPTTQGSFNKKIFDDAFDEFENLYDKKYGGFGNSPKFPSPHQLKFLIRYAKDNNDRFALEMVENTLTKMSLGGINDHIGKGFHRYSTDKQWLVPHFEKMLYDQANLISAYSELYSITKNEKYKDIARDIIDYITRELLSDDGVFYSAEDADSEGIEGKFYVWTKEEIEKILGNDAELYCKIYNIYSNGNYKEEVAGHGAGGNIIYLKDSLTNIAKEVAKNKEDILKILNQSNLKLFKEREKRIHPFKDKKVMVDWNSLVISSLCDYAKATNDLSFLKIAIKCENYISNKCMNNNKISHLVNNKSFNQEGFLDDYAFYIKSLLDLYQLTYRNEYLVKAIDLTNSTIQLFYSETKNAFYFTHSDNNDVLVRKIEFYDGANPSGNSIMLMNLLVLNKITANETYQNIANKMLDSFYTLVKKSPTSFSQFLIAAQFAYGNDYEIVIVGEKSERNIQKVNKLINNEFNPNITTIWKEDDNDKINNIANYTKMMYQIDNKLTIYVCKNYSCENPTNDLNLIKKYLEIKDKEK